MAMAFRISTQLWLGGVLCTDRDTHLVWAPIRKRTLCRPLLFRVDGCGAYVEITRQVFREPIPTGKAGHLVLRPWDGSHMAQVVKTYARKRVVGVTR